MRIFSVIELDKDFFFCLVVAYFASRLPSFFPFRFFFFFFLLYFLLHLRGTFYTVELCSIRRRDIFFPFKCERLMTTKRGE